MICALLDPPEARDCGCTLPQSHTSSSRLVAPSTVAKAFSNLGKGGFAA